MMSGHPFEQALRHNSLILLPSLLFYVMSLMACTANRLPVELTEDTNTEIDQLRTVRLDNLLEGMNDPISLTVAERKFDAALSERVAWLNIGNEEPVMIGKLRPLLPDSAVELAFVDLAESRFIVVWVDDSIDGALETVTLGRPIQLPEDDGLRVLRSAAIDNRVAVVPIFSDEIELWSEVEVLLVDKRGLGFALEKEFDPPIRIDHLFQEFDMP